MTNKEQLFQISVLDEFVTNQDMELIKSRWLKFQNFLSKRDYIESVKEEKYQDGFFQDVFEESLGYTLDSNNPNDYNLEREKKNTIDAKKADGAIVIDTHIVGLIELKGQDTQNLDKRGSREQSAVDQLFGYLNSHDSTYAKYAIVSNFNELRFYIADKTNYESFFLLDMDFESFCRLHTILSYESIVAQIPLQIKERSVTFEIDISNSFYKDYTKFRTELFENIIQNNQELDHYTLLNATQKLIDRIVFILFGEDTGLLPLNTIPTIIKEHQAQRLTDYSLYDVYKIYFQAINSGNSRLDIERYNGGLFAPDEYLDSLVIDDEVLDSQARILSAYRFGSDISVNILGHIFEQSISDLEEMTAQIANESFDKKQSKRKKDGVFYTPAYITKYIVANTLGTLCQNKREELEIADIALTKGTKSKTKEALNSRLESYKEWLLNLKILDPACGSGAFLNQALEFLIEEHKSLQLDFAKLGNIFMTYNIEKSILENNLYGVDINEGAVEIAKLSLWLRTATKGRSLTTLADKIKVGNSLIDDRSVVDNAFVWEEEFSEVFQRGGFDVVIGNPPYVRQELLDSDMKSYFKTKYTIHHNSADLYIFFIEKGISLLSKNGKFSFIVPNKWLKAKYGKPLREWLKLKGLDEIVDFGDLQIFQGATTYPMIMTLTNQDVNKKFSFMGLESLDFGDLEEYVQKNSSEIILENLSDDAWQLVSKDVQNVLNKAMKNSISLGQYTEGQINRGILTGLNDAFIINEETRNKLIEEEQKSIDVIKPFYVGQDIQRYGNPDIEKWLLYIPWDFEIDKYTAIKKHLEQFKDKLAKRPEVKQNRYPWYALSRYGSKYILDFEESKIIYLVFQVKPAFIIDVNNTYSNNATFIYPKEDYFLLGILNSKLGWFLISNSCTEIQGGYQLIYDYFKNIPIPLEVESDKKEKLELLVKKIVLVNQSLQTKANRFIKRLQSSFEIEKISKKLETFYQYDFKTFVKELKKKKVTLSLVEQDEWEEYFEAYQKELLDLEAQINTTDREIDLMVYKLYGLSDGEIGIVEGKKNE